jgi:hypothetical protein
LALLSTSLGISCGSLASGRKGRIVFILKVTDARHGWVNVIFAVG